MVILNIVFPRGQAGCNPVCPKHQGIPIAVFPRAEAGRWTICSANWDRMRATVHIRATTCSQMAPVLSKMEHAGLAGTMGCTYLMNHKDTWTSGMGKCPKPRLARRFRHKGMFVSQHKGVLVSRPCVQATREECAEPTAHSFHCHHGRIEIQWPLPRRLLSLPQLLFHRFPL